MVFLKIVELKIKIIILLKIFFLSKENKKNLLFIIFLFITDIFRFYFLNDHEIR